jgi:hypothetical protein
VSENGTAKEAELARNLRVLDVTREDERPRERSLSASVGVDIDQHLEVDADDFYERGFAIARALRAWSSYSGEGERQGFPAPTGLEQAVERVTSLADKDFDAGYEKAVGDVKGAAVVGRAKAIDAVRLLMTALIRQQAGGPINLHIDSSKDGAKDRWRLFEPAPDLGF